jgi:hypothetical protein
MWGVGPLLEGAISLTAKIALAAAMVWFVLWLRRRTPVARRPSGSADVRRWFRFRTTGLLLAMVVVAVVAMLLRESRWTFLEGTWHGFKPQFSNCSMLVHYDRLTLFENGQATTFTMKFPSRFKAEEIDLYGPDGLQLGMFGGGDRQFELQVAEPGEPRPPMPGPSVGGKSRFFVFERDP